MERGFFSKPEYFSCSIKKSFRHSVLITVLQTYKQIESMVATVNEVFMAALQRNNFSLEQINDAFRIVAGLDSRSTGTFLN